MGGVCVFFYYWKGFGDLVVVVGGGLCMDFGYLF